jgi:hypothetical protein
MRGDTARALRETLVSPNEADTNFEPANVVNGLYAIAHAIQAVAAAGDNLAAAVAELTRAVREGRGEV